MKLVWHRGADGFLLVRTRPDADPVEIRSPAAVVAWLAAEAATVGLEDAQQLGCCAMLLALGEVRSASAGLVLAAADHVVRGHPPPPAHAEAFERGVSRLRDHLLPLRGEAWGTLADAALPFVKAALKR